MNSFFSQSIYIGALISLLAYFLGVFLKKKFKSGIFNPLLISIVLTIVILVIGKVEYSSYMNSAKYLSYLLTPATVCLAIPLYEKLELLKKNFKAVIAGLIAGVISSLLTIFVLSLSFNLDHASYVTLLPKSITTAIGIGVSEELGGYVTITVVVIVITGVFGNMFGEIILKAFGIKESIAKGLALGCSSHAIGTAKAIEIGEVEGAMSSLAIAVSGILTVILAPIFALFM